MNKTALAVVIATVAFARGTRAQGNPVGPEFQVNTYTTSAQVYPSVASDAAGNFVVVWSGQDGAGGGIFGQRYHSSGVPLGPEFRVNTYTTGNQYIPSVAEDDSGSFVVVWNSNGQDGSYSGVFGQRFDSAGAPAGPEFRVNTFTTSFQRFPAVAHRGPGGFVVVWESEQGGPGGTDVFGQRYASSGAPSGPEFQVNTVVSFNQSGAAVAVDPAGNFVVAWASEYQGTPAGPTIIGRRYSSSGAPLDGEFPVNVPQFTTIQVSADVKTDAAGNFVVVWGSFGGGPNGEIFGRRFAVSGAPLSAEFRVNTFTTGRQVLPDLAMDASGNFVVVWDSENQDGSSYGIFGQRYESSGLPLGPEFRVNSYTSAGQRRPSVSADPAGNFVVAWDSDLQDGSSFGVFAQRYAPILPVELMRFEVE